MPQDQIQKIPFDQIYPGNNDRTVFDEDALSELANSIKENGLIQPITVRLFAPDPGAVFGGDRFGEAAQYQIVAGERRFRALRILEVEEIPCIVKELTDSEASAIMLSENVSRDDLDPIDEANAYHHRISNLGWTVKECAEKAGVSDIRVQFRLKLLHLRDDVQDLVRSGNLQMGYARILADAKLDTNRQMLAISNLQKNPRPTTGWFRKLVNEYAEQQNQAKMFEDDFLVCQHAPIEALNFDTPPSPAVDNPEIKGETPEDTILQQIEYWKDASEGWEKLGKTFKQKECNAAVSALQYAFSSIYG